MNKIKVSILVLTYNPNIDKLNRTICSVLSQKNIDFEIIVSDDGSKTDCFDEINNTFEHNSFQKFVMNKNKDNVGTVKNILSALKFASGKYVYMISPSDMIYDENTICNFCNYADKMSAKVCFGDYIGYNENNGEVNTYVENLAPKNTDVYSKGLKNYKTSFFLNGYILGPTFLRERKSCIEAMSYVSKFSRYVEDNTSTAYYLANNTEIFYYNQKVVWYEVGTGISQGNNSGWSVKVENDIINTFRGLTCDYPKDKIVKAGLDIRTVKNKTDLFKALLKHPSAYFRKLYLDKICSEHKVLCDENDIQLLKQKIKE